MALTLQEARGVLFSSRQQLVALTSQASARGTLDLDVYLAATNRAHDAILWVEDAIDLAARRYAVATISVGGLMGRAVESALDDLANALAVATQMIKPAAQSREGDAHGASQTRHGRNSTPIGSA